MLVCKHKPRVVALRVENRTLELQCILLLTNIATNYFYISTFLVYEPNREAEVLIVRYRVATPRLLVSLSPRVFHCLAHLLI